MVHLRNPFFVENFGDQPYPSLMLVAPLCTNPCSGCHNSGLLEAPIKSFSVTRLAHEYESNPFVEGITIGGLEIFDSGEDFLGGILDIIITAKIPKITIYTRFLMSDRRVADYASRIKKLESVSELYFKTGQFIENSTPKVSLGITLSSENQNFERIK